MILGNHIDDIVELKTEIICKDYIPLHKSNYNILAGDGGVGKSAIALKEIAHFLRANPEEKCVAFFTEDSKKQILERLDTITSQMSGITTEEIKERTFFNTLDDNKGQPFAIKQDRNNYINYDYFNQFIVNAKFHKVGLIILDPLEFFHSNLNENDAEDMKFLVTDGFQKLATETESAILVLHHTNKGDKGGARGSGVITNKGRVAYNVRKVMEEDKEMGIQKIKKGWEHSVLLTTIKDNHYIARYCDAIQNHYGKLDLPIVMDTTVEVTEFTADEIEFVGGVL